MQTLTVHYYNFKEREFEVFIFAQNLAQKLLGFRRNGFEPISAGLATISRCN
jgi:hypothetical protein